MLRFTLPMTVVFSLCYFVRKSSIKQSPCVAVMAIVLANCFIFAHRQRQSKMSSQLIGVNLKLHFLLCLFWCP